MYPLNVFHAGLKGYAVANSEDEHKALTDMGYEPAFAGQESETQEVNFLRAQLEARGLAVDKRWGVARLQAELAK